MSEITINIPETFTIAQIKQLQEEVVKLVSSVSGNTLKTEGGEFGCSIGVDRGGFRGECGVSFRF